MQSAASTQSWTVWIEVLLGLAVAVAVLGRGGDGAAPSLIFLIGGASAAYTAYVTYRAIQALSDDRLPATAGAEDRREALEYEKNLALAALKELEADAAMGKVDARDLPTLKATAEARALALIKQIRDEDALWRRRAEAAVGGTPAASGAVSTAARASRSSPEPAPAAASKPASAGPTPEAAAGVACGSCGFDGNPAKARFCIQCGHPRSAA